MSEKSFIICGDCLEEIKKLDENSVDSIVTDPPYGLNFMGRSWDDFEPLEYQKFSNKWGGEAIKVLKPGGYLLAFSGTRTYHRMVCGLEDAGFVIKDQIDWLYGSGFPKSRDMSKAIDKKLLREKLTEKLGHKPTLDQLKQALEQEREKVGEYQYPDGNERNTEEHVKVDSTHSYQGMEIKYNEKGRPITASATSEAEKWDGWGTALKPAHEPIVVAQKPREGTYAENILEVGVGGLNIDACRIEAKNKPEREVHEMREDIDYNGSALEGRVDGSFKSSKAVETTDEGRWPTNVILNPVSAELLDEQSGELESGSLLKSHNPDVKEAGRYGKFGIDRIRKNYQKNSGGASRFFYSSKVHKGERNAGLKNLDDVNMGQSGGARQKLKEGEDEYQTGDDVSVGLNKIKKVKNDCATVKPINLMRYLCRLVTPPNGTVLDPFAGSGTTGCACEIEEFDYVLIEKRERFANVIAPKRCEYWSKEKNWSELKDHEELEDPTKRKVADLEAFCDE